VTVEHRAAIITSTWRDCCSARNAITVSAHTNQRSRCKVMVA